MAARVAVGDAVAVAAVVVAAAAEVAAARVAVVAVRAAVVVARAVIADAADRAATLGVVAARPIRVAAKVAAT